MIQRITKNRLLTPADVVAIIFDASALVATSRLGGGGAASALRAYDTASASLSYLH